MSRASSTGLQHGWRATFAVAATLLLLLAGSWNQLWNCEMSGLSLTSPCPCADEDSPDGELQQETQAERSHCCARSQTQDTQAVASVAEWTSPAALLPVHHERASAIQPRRARTRSVREALRRLVRPRT